MIYTKRFLNSAAAKRLPKWIQSHRVFRDNSKIKKVFPEIGLSNCVDDCPIPITDYDGRNKNMKIVFSSDGITGLWDIGTMSMRGVLSCMHWDNKPHCTHLIGSMVDPCCGIIYMTDGTKTEYGSSILKRALVRFATSHDNTKFVYIDRIYTKSSNTNPLVYENKDPRQADISNLFTAFLKAKTWLPVFATQSDMPSAYRYQSVIPRAKILAKLPPNYLSLVDCGMSYSPPDCADTELTNLLDDYN